LTCSEGIVTLGYECVLLSDLTGGPKQLEAEMVHHLHVTGFFYANVRSSSEALEQLKKGRNP